MNANELRKMSSDELKKEYLASLRESFNLRMQKSSGQMTRTHNLKVVRRNIARILTIIKEKMGNNS